MIFSRDLSISPWLYYLGVFLENSNGSFFPFIVVIQSMIFNWRVNGISYRVIIEKTLVFLMIVFAVPLIDYNFGKFFFLFS